MLTILEAGKSQIKATIHSASHEGTISASTWHLLTWYLLDGGSSYQASRTSFIKVLILFFKVLFWWPDHLSKAIHINIVTLGLTLWHVHFRGRQTFRSYWKKSMKAKSGEPTLDLHRSECLWCPSLKLCVKDPGWLSSSCDRLIYLLALILSCCALLWSLFLNIYWSLRVGEGKTNRTGWSWCLHSEWYISNFL